MLDFSSLFIAPPQDSVLYAGNYDLLLVGLSILVAVLAAYAALLVSQLVARRKIPHSRPVWLGVGSLCLGMGIWAMHFVGMLAFSLPCVTGYSPLTTLLSTVPGVLASVLALTTISRPTLSRRRLVLGGVLIGAGIGAMHYSGMAAMQLNGFIRYDWKLFLLSIGVAVGLAILALWIKFRVQVWQHGWERWATPVSALVLGLAVSGMHYTAMAAAYFVRGDGAATADVGVSPNFLAAIVLTATSLIAVVTVVATYIGKPNFFSLKQSSKWMMVLVLGWVGIAWLGADYYYGHLTDNVYQQELDTANQKATDIADNVSKNLQLLKGIALVVSKEEAVLAALRRFGPSATPSPLPPPRLRALWLRDAQLNGLNAELAIYATHLNTDEVFIVNTAGDCIASSNADTSNSFVGENYADRDYFRQARVGYPGYQYAVGRTSGISGLFYSHPIMENGRFFGIAVVKRNISNVAYWTNPEKAFLADVNGVIVVSSRPSWEFRALPNATMALSAMTEAKKWQQYRRKALQPLHVTSLGESRFPDAVRIDDDALPSVLAAKMLSESAMTVYVPRPLTELVRLRSERYWLFVLLAMAGSMLIVSTSTMVLYLREMKKTEADLRVAATAFESQEGMVITDAQHLILRVNRAFTEITGYTAEEVIGHTPSRLKSGRQDARFYEAMWQTIHATGSWQGEVWNQRRNGEIYPEWLTVTAVKGSTGQVTHYVGTLMDISSRKAAEEEIQYLAFYDSLTQLPNRRLLLDRLQRALATGSRSHRQGALLFIDLDNFKTLNDTLGHDMGDSLLQQVALRLRDAVREGDTVARLGGDEFVVMLEDLSLVPLEAVKHAETVGEHILKVLNQAYWLADNEYHSTASVGIALFCGHQESVDELLKRADIAMYQAKTAGRNTLRFFDPDMQAVVSARATLEIDLRQGVQESQFVLYYQPQVGREGQLTGVEALVRWLHPTRGLVSPAEFIPLAEETGLILPLGLFVLEAACQQLQVWASHPTRCDLSIAVNVSARQFRHRDFLDQVLQVLDRTGINPSLLKLELTESLLLEDAEDIIAKMSALKLRGLGFSLDDFGTGYSSLSYLKRLPLDQLKIDQSFVRDLLTDPNDAAISRTIIALAESLGLKVIAEGVETQAQRDCLAEQGCHAYQGYLFSRPLPIAEFEAKFG